MAESSYPISPAVVEQRRAAATRHGVRSEYHVTRVAKNRKRAILRQMRVRASDLDAVANVMVDLLARGLAKLSLLDDYYDVHGIVREDGQPEPTLPVYVTTLNAARLTARNLADHMARQGVRGEDLDTYIIEQYGNGKSAADA